MRAFFVVFCDPPGVWLLAISLICNCFVFHAFPINTKHSDCINFKTQISLGTYIVT